MGKTLSAIVAIALDGAIGKDGDLLWHLSADMKHFKSITMGHSIVMGRRTFESLPKGALHIKHSFIKNGKENEQKHIRLNKQIP